MNGNDELYAQARTAFGAALRRLARGYEADPHPADLVYRVAHNVAASHILSNRRTATRLVDLDGFDAEPGFVDGEEQVNRQYLVGRLLDRIYRLKPLDRQVILLYLEGEPAASISDVTGLSTSNVATKIHRIKRLLGREPSEGAIHGTR